MLKQYKALHNTTDVDTVKRAIRAIEIEEYYAHTPVDERAFPKLNSLIIGVDIAGNYAVRRYPTACVNVWTKGW